MNKDCTGKEYEIINLPKNSCDLTNQTFNKLTAKFPVKVKNDKTRGQWWLCQCECGNLFCTVAQRLKHNNTKSCGCLAGIQNLANKTFGYLTVIEQEKEKKNRRIYWKCQCKCGNIISVDTTRLLSGHTKSCGCYHKEIIRNNVINQKFYCLTALEEVSNKKYNGGTVWKFKCDCGNIIEAPLTMVINGGKKSCGCQTISYGEMRIKQILDQNNITYLHDKRYFKDLIMTNGGIGRYDFILFDNMKKPYRLIEFDGQQHFGHSPEFWGGKVALDIRIKNDLIKNEYAKTHNIPLVRIPYTYENKITLELILGNQFLIT